MPTLGRSSSRIKVGDFQRHPKFFVKQYAVMECKLPNTSPLRSRVDSSFLTPPPLYVTRMFAFSVAQQRPSSQRTTSCGHSPVLLRTLVALLFGC